MTIFRVLVAGLLVPLQAGAQPSRPPVVEFSATIWRPAASLVLSSGRTEPGTPVDFNRDLGLSDRWVQSVQGDWRPARRHSVRFEWQAPRYTQTARPAREIVFTGTPFPAGQPIASTVKWTTWRVGYAYDVVTRARGSLGVVIDLKQNYVTARLTGSGADEVRPTSLPLPMLGLIGRLRAAPRVELAGEATGFGVPDNATHTYGGRLIDAQLNAIIQLTPHLAVRAGYRDVNVRHLGDTDSGRMRLRGPQAGLVVRF